MAEKVFVEYLPARDKGTSQKDFCKEFRIRYEGARSQDVEFITRVMEQSLRSSELKAKEDEESAEGEPNTKVKERSTISTATRSPAAPTTTKLSKKEEEKKKKKKKDKKKEQKPEKAGQSTAPPPEPTTPSPPTPTNPSSSHSKVQKETRKDAEASEKEPSPRKEAKMAEPEPKSVPELEEEEQEGDDNDGDGGNDEDGIGPKPPSDHETEEGTIKIIEPWFPEPSKKGGMKWKIVYEVTLANGEKERRVDYDHKDEQIGHIKNYRRHPKWEAIYESRRR